MVKALVRICASTALTTMEMAGKMAAIPTAEDISNAVPAIAAILQFADFGLLALSAGPLSIRIAI